MLSPWVTERRNETRFALQVFPIETPVNRSKALIAVGQQAEALGFDAFFAGDHPAWGPECWVHLAALAATTSRIGLGINVSCIWYRHPLLTARLAADLDQISDGRTILGLGVGWDENEFAAFGIPFPPAGERQAARAVSGFRERIERIAPSTRHWPPETVRCGVRRFPPLWNKARRHSRSSRSVPVRLSARIALECGGAPPLWLEAERHIRTRRPITSRCAPGPPTAKRST